MSTEFHIRFGVAGRPVIDCAVVLHRGLFHLYAPDNGRGAAPGGPRDGGWLVIVTGPPRDR